jgi:hypothetical protein
MSIKNQDRSQVGLTGAQSSAIVETVDLGSGRFNGVAAGQGRGVMIEKPVHMIGITTVVTHVLRHGEYDLGGFDGGDGLERVGGMGR